MAQSYQKKSVQKITLSCSRDIPFDKLLLSQSNVRHVKAGVSLEELAENIARRGLLQGLSVRAVVDKAGVETGMYEIAAGGRRYRALTLLKERAGSELRLSRRNSAGNASGGRLPLPRRNGLQAETVEARAVLAPPLRSATRAWRATTRATAPGCIWASSTRIAVPMMLTSSPERATATTRSRVAKGSERW